MRLKKIGLIGCISFILVCFSVGTLEAAEKKPHSTAFLVEENFFVFCDKSCFSSKIIRTAIEIFFNTFREEFDLDGEFLKNTFQEKKVNITTIFVSAEKGLIYCRGLTSGDYEWCKGTTVFYFRNDKTVEVIITVVVDSDCIARTSFVHELLHVYWKVLLDDIDQGHEREYLWKNGGLLDKINLEIGKSLCKGDD